MKTLQERADNYNKTFPKFAEKGPLCATDSYIYGIWMIGNNYRNKNKYYGEYPPNYLKRISSLFPDQNEILHLFSGSLSNDPEIKGETFDLNPDLKATYCGNAEELSSIVNKKYDIIFTDPPYSEEDAKKYGTCLIKRNKVLKECVKVLKMGGFLVWLDQVFPMFRKVELNLIGTIGVIRSTNHRVRTVFIWEKIGEVKT